MNEEKMFCRKQLQVLGVKCEPLGLAITRHIANGKTEVEGEIFSFSLSESLGQRRRLPDHLRINGENGKRNGII